ncbi:hypothetical protein KSF78_0007655 [Schistosoma japonicum]|nr:hypothetical protein KSF78_0007655 [Schistosoma japonicum]
MSRYRLDDTCYVCDCLTYTSRNNLHLSYSFDSSLKYDIVLYNIAEVNEGAPYNLIIILTNIVEMYQKQTDLRLKMGTFDFECRLHSLSSGVE